jgi:N-acetylglucosaminyl-diphospho-decaprenol L-rhamnosyltransferase
VSFTLNISVHVFIVHWNRPEEALATTQRFLDQKLPLRISIVDNASRIELYERLRQQLTPEVQLVRLKENRGWGGGLNVLLQSWLSNQDGDVCVVSAHDALPEGDCIRQLLDAMHHHSEFGIVCPEYGKPELPSFTPIRGPRLLPIQPRPPGLVEPVVFSHGTLMVLRRACLADIGLFDERYFAYGDETEIGLRARRKGWQVAIVWGAIVTNPGSWTPGPLIGYLWARSSLLMARTYGGWWHALVRASLMMVQTLKFTLLPSSWKTMSSPRARTLAVWHFLLGRFGPP